MDRKENEGMTSASQCVLNSRNIFLTGVLVMLTAAGCSSPDTGSSGSARASAPPEVVSQGSDVLAEIDGKPITLSEVEGEAGDRLAAMDFQYRSQRHQLIDATLKKIVRERLLEEEASARGMGREELVQAEMSNVEVSDEEVNRWYQQNKARLGGRTLEQVSTQIRQFLSQQKREGIMGELTAELEKKSKVVYHIQPLRADIDVGDSPAKGPSDAPVTLVEFSDFECGYCGRLRKTLSDIKDNYGDQLRIVFRQFPLQMHRNAQKAAQAALCANDQGKFWPMHDLLFQEQSQLDVVALKDKASRLGLDRAVFDSCLDSGRHAETVQKDMRDGAGLGVTGTPAMFINGIPLPGGALPYEAVAKAIDEELERIDDR
jgi:protein-disulfide isomerase